MPVTRYQYLAYDVVVFTFDIELFDSMESLIFVVTRKKNEDDFLRILYLVHLAYRVLDEKNCA